MRMKKTLIRGLLVDTIPNYPNHKNLMADSKKYQGAMWSKRVQWMNLTLIYRYFTEDLKLSCDANVVQLQAEYLSH